MLVLLTKAMFAIRYGVSSLYRKYAAFSILSSRALLLGDALDNQRWEASASLRLRDLTSLYHVTHRIFASSHFIWHFECPDRYSLSPQFPARSYVPAHNSLFLQWPPRSPCHVHLRPARNQKVFFEHSTQLSLFWQPLMNFVRVRFFRSCALT